MARRRLQPRTAPIAQEARPRHQRSFLGPELDPRHRAQLCLDRRNKLGATECVSI